MLLILTLQNAVYHRYNYLYVMGVKVATLVGPIKESANNVNSNFIDTKDATSTLE
jgi:hypothetical protein